MRADRVVFALLEHGRCWRGLSTAGRRGPTPRPPADRRARPGRRRRRATSQAASVERDPRQRRVVSCAARRCSTATRARRSATTRSASPIRLRFQPGRAAERGGSRRISRSRSARRWQRRSAGGFAVEADFRDRSVLLVGVLPARRPARCRPPADRLRRLVRRPSSWPLYLRVPLGDWLMQQNAPVTRASYADMLAFLRDLPGRCSRSRW